MIPLNNSKHIYVRRYYKKNNIEVLSKPGVLFLIMQVMLIREIELNWSAWAIHDINNNDNYYDS